MRTRVYDIHDQTRQRMIQETSRFIEFGLQHPELFARIPAKPQDEAGWPAPVARFFWDTIFRARDLRRAGAGIFRSLLSRLRQ